MKRWGNFLILAVACTMLAVVPAQAIPVIDFGTGAASGGTITFDGTNYVGTDIGIGILKVWNPSETTWTIDANLDFATAANTITVTLDTAQVINSVNIAAGTVLLTGSFTSFADHNSDIHKLSFEAEGPDSKSLDLLTALGIPHNTKWAYFGFTISAVELEADGKKFAATSTDIQNVAVPEPGTMLLLGTGLLGLGLIRRRKVRS